MKSIYLPLLFTFALFSILACNSSEQKSTAASTESAALAKEASPSKNSTLSSQTFRGLKIQPIDFPARTYMGIREKVPMDQIQAFYGKNLGKVFTACQAYGLEMAGMPSGLFYEFNEEAKYIDMAATVEVKSGKDLGDGISAIKLPASNALQIDYYGPYKGISDAHYAMDDYMSLNNVTQNRRIPTIEEYVTDPSTQPDPNKRLTRIIYFYR